MSAGIILNVDGLEIPVSVVRKRVKNLNLRVRADGTVTLSIPQHLPLARAREFLELQGRLDSPSASAATSSAGPRRTLPASCPTAYRSGESSSHATLFKRTQVRPSAGRVPAVGRSPVRPLLAGTLAIRAPLVKPP